jgi:hypothetical protein
MTTTLEISLITDQQIPTAGEMLARAFFDDPLTSACRHFERIHRQCTAGPQWYLGFGTINSLLPNGPWWHRPGPPEAARPGAR